MNTANHENTRTRERVAHAKLTHAHAQATFFIQILYLLAKIRMMLNLSQEQALCKKYNGYFANYISLIFCTVCCALLTEFRTLSCKAIRFRHLVKKCIFHTHANTHSTFLNFLIMYLTLIYNSFNILIRIEERNSYNKAKMAGKSWTTQGGWYRVVRPENSTEVDMWYSLLNM